MTRLKNWSANSYRHFGRPIRRSKVPEQVHRLHRVFARIGLFSVAPASGEPRLLDAMFSNLRSLSERVALSHGKQVRLTAYADDPMIFRNRIAWLVIDQRLAGVMVVAMAGDGLQAIEQARLHKPDFVTMDLTMPVMNGPACLETLRTVLPDARVLVVSALSDRATALRAMTKGAHGFLRKPFSDTQGVESLQELMA